MTELIILWLHVYAVCFLILAIYYNTRRPAQPVSVITIGAQSVYIALALVGFYSLVKFLM